MLISHQFSFVFMHNPKVGGTSVRHTISRFAAHDGRYYNCDPDPESPTHQIDRAHMGIDEFLQFYPEQWDRVKNYQFYALWRPPGDRIYSSVQQYSRNFAQQDVRFLTPPQRRDFLMRIFDTLSGYGTAEDIMSAFELTHFRPQWIYMMSDVAQPMVQTIPLSRIDQFFTQISQRTGVTDLRSEKTANSSEWVALPGGLSNLAASKYRKALNAVPGVKPLAQAAKRLMVSRERRPVADNFGLSEADLEEVNRFVMHFYARDFQRLPLEQEPTASVP